MSGFEVAGVILAVIPLVLEAFDRSDRAFSAFRTFGRYPKEVLRLQAKFRAQKSIFRNDCIHLLAAVTNDNQRAHDLVRLATQATWDDEEIRETFHQRAAAVSLTLDSCRDIIQEINGVIGGFDAELQGFKSVVLGSGGTNVASKEFYKQIGQRVKLSMFKPRLEKRLESLRSLTHDFHLMTEQTTTSLRAASSASTVVREGVSPQRIAKIRRVREASQRLFETLVCRWTCGDHLRHSAALFLGEEIKDVNEQTPYVRFQLAVTSMYETASPDQAIWLAVDSIVNDTGSHELSEKVTGVMDLLKVEAQATAVEAVGVPVVAKQKRPKKSVKFAEAGTEGKDLGQPQPQELPAPDLSQVQDFCKHFMQHEQCTKGLACRGYLNDRGMYRFYQAPPTPTMTRRDVNRSRPSIGSVHSDTSDLSTATTVHDSSSMLSQSINANNSTSLTSLLGWIAEDAIVRSVPRSTLLSLATILSMTVLQLDSTPWLPENWRSHDIHFHGLRDGEQAISLAKPYLNLDFVKSRHGQISDPDTAEGSLADSFHRQNSALRPTYRDQDIAADCARNESLFRLGIVLIELGYAKPWAQLRLSVVDALPAQRNNDYYVAEKLAALLVNTMGPKYSRIVRKCIGCDFGLGESNLSSEDLQKMFFSDVVAALQKMNQQLPNFD